MNVLLTTSHHKYIPIAKAVFISLLFTCVLIKASSCLVCNNNVYFGTFPEEQQQSNQLTPCAFYSFVDFCCYAVSLLRCKLLNCNPTLLVKSCTRNTSQKKYNNNKRYQEGDKEEVHEERSAMLTITVV